MHVTFITIVMFALTAIIATVFVAGLRRPAVIPGKLQNAVEAGVDAVRENIVCPTLGAGRRAVSCRYLTSLFFFVFAMNFMEIVPVVQFPLTSRMAIPALFCADRVRDVQLPRHPEAGTASATSRRSCSRRASRSRSTSC